MGQGLLWREAPGNLCEDEEDPALRAEHPSPALQGRNGRHQTSVWEWTGQGKCGRRQAGDISRDQIT